MTLSGYVERESFVGRGSIGLLSFGPARVYLPSQLGVSCSEFPLKKGTVYGRKLDNMMAFYPVKLPGCEEYDMIENRIRSAWIVPRKGNEQFPFKEFDSVNVRACYDEKSVKVAPILGGTPVRKV
jgi:hypothetical protein